MSISSMEQTLFKAYGGISYLEKAKQSAAEDVDLFTKETALAVKNAEKAETKEGHLFAGAVNVSAHVAYISHMYNTGRPDAATFEDAFPMYKVVTHVGNTEVSSGNWQRNDFPFWDYFNKNATADCLNDWKPVGPNPPQTDAGIQRKLGSIGAGKMALLIPESLQAKMDADEHYAKEIIKKVQKWKEDYDRWNNSTAESYGYNAAAYQAELSYCLQLDENGDVVQSTITGCGHFTKSGDEMVKNYYKRKKRHEEFERIAEEKAIRRKQQEQEAAVRYRQRRIIRQSLSARDDSGLFQEQKN